jgi:hypothetical protein
VRWKKTFGEGAYSCSVGNRQQQLGILDFNAPPWTVVA